MLRVFKFRETGEKRPPQKGEYYLNENELGFDSIHMAYFEHETSFPILLLEKPKHPNDFAIATGSIGTVIGKDLKDA